MGLIHTIKVVRTCRGSGQAIEHDMCHVFLALLHDGLRIQKLPIYMCVFVGFMRRCNIKERGLIRSYSVQELPV
jgi:hypothetical protein